MLTLLCFVLVLLGLVLVLLGFVLVLLTLVLVLLGWVLAFAVLWRHQFIFCLWSSLCCSCRHFVGLVVSLLLLLVVSFMFFLYLSCSCRLIVVLFASLLLLSSLCCPYRLFCCYCRGFSLSGSTSSSSTAIWPMCLAMHSASFSLMSSMELD